MADPAIQPGSSPEDSGLNPFEPSVSREMGDIIKQARSAVGANQNDELVSRALPELNVLSKRILNSSTLCFDIDYTLNRQRGKAISEEAAELLLQFISLDKKIRIISGKTFDEFLEGGTLAPLLRRLNERNVECELVVYSADGGEKVFLRSDGSFRHDEKYSAEYKITGQEAAVIRNVLQEADSSLDREHSLRRKGIRTFMKEYMDLAVKWSPYGREDPDEYAFEKNKEAQDPNSPPRKTRGELASEIDKKLRSRGLKGIAVSVSGKTTIGFCREGINKKMAVLDVLKEAGRVTYFGDEMSSGNDRVVGEMAEGHAYRLTVVSLDKSEGPFPAGVYHIGGQHDGTVKVLEKAYRLCSHKSTNTSPKMKEVRQVLKEFGLSGIKEILRLAGGHGTHAPFYQVETPAEGKFVLRHVRSDLFKDTFQAALYEAWVVRKLISGGVPFAPLRPKAGSPENCKDDDYVVVSQDGTPYLLYSFIEGEVGSHDGMNEQRLESMIRMLAKMHRILADEQPPYKREYRHANILEIADDITKIERLAAEIRKEKEIDPKSRYSRGERLLVENAQFIIKQLSLAATNLKPLYDRLKKLPIHSDFHPPNGIFEGDKLVGVIDLEHMRSEARIYDLAPMIRMGVEEGRFNLEHAAAVVLLYDKENALTPEEAEALPEIFRFKLLDRVCRLVNPERHYESMSFHFGGVQDARKSLAMIDHNDRLFSWYQDLIMAIRDLHTGVTFGDFRRRIQDRLPKASRAQIFASHLDRLREERRGHRIDFPKPSGYSLDDMLKRAVPIEKLMRKEPGKWSRTGNIYLNSFDEKNAWWRLNAGDQVLFSADKVLVYREPEGTICVAIRGNDMAKVRANADKAFIQIELDAQERPKAVHMRQPSDLDLSRSSLAIQLSDSGVFDDFPAFGDLLRSQLVWQDVEGGLKHREILDSYDIRWDVLQFARNHPGRVDAAQISGIVYFRHFKTRVIRRAALEVLGKLYEHGRISPSEYSRYVSEFIGQDISEDFRVIERRIKSDPRFVAESFKNLFGMEGVTTADLDHVTLKYCDQGPAKAIYRVGFHMKDGTERPAAITTMRHDPFNQDYGLTEDKIESSVAIWKALSEAKLDGMVKYGSHTWELDYRTKEVIKGGTAENPLKEKFVNNVEVSCRAFVPGKSLADILSDKEASPEYKRQAVEACRKLCRQIYTASLEHKDIGKGYFIYPPEPRKFIVTNMENGGVEATLTETYHLVDYRSVDVLVACFDESVAELRSRYEKPLKQQEYTEASEFIPPPADKDC